MYLLRADDRERLAAVVGGEGAVALRFEIYFQRRDYVLFVIADKYVVHSLHLAYYINVSQLKNQEVKLLRKD